MVVNCRRGPRPSKRSPIWTYFTAIEKGMQCPVCEEIKTAVNSKFNAANLEQHLATHPESEKYKQFVLDKKQWLVNEPRRNLKRLIPLATKRWVKKFSCPFPTWFRRPRTKIANDEERQARRRATTRESVKRTRQRDKELKRHNVGLQGTLLIAVARKVTKIVACIVSV